MPDFFVQVEMLRCRLPDHGALAEPPQPKPMMLVQIVKSFGRRRRGRTGLAEMLDDAPLLAKDRDHASILTYSRS